MNQSLSTFDRDQEIVLNILYTSHPPSYYW